MKTRKVAKIYDQISMKTFSECLLYCSAERTTCSRKTGCTPHHKKRKKM